MPENKEEAPLQSRGRSVGATSSSSQALSRPPLLDIKEAAVILRICKRKVWELSNTGELPSVRIGRALRFDPTDLAEAIDKWKTGRRA
jgi:excisionase family DNA binding protein